MNKLFKPLAYLIFLAFFITTSCNNSNSTQENTSESAMNTATEATAIQVDAAQLATIKDLVCGMSMKNVPISDTLQHNGKVYPFCNKACKEIFQKNIAKYAIN